MLTLEPGANFASWKLNSSTAHLALAMFLLMALAGCTGDGAGGPVISSLATPPDATTEVNSDQELSSQSADSGGSDEEDPKITMTSTSTGVTARVTWDRPSDFNAAGYTIYYEKRSPQEPRSEESNSEEPSSQEQESEPSACSYGESQTVQAPSATITGLEPNTQYLFAIRAFNENASESLCSNEITAVTPPAHS